MTPDAKRRRTVAALQTLAELASAYRHAIPKSKSVVFLDGVRVMAGAGKDDPSPVEVTTLTPSTRRIFDALPPDTCVAIKFQ